MRITITGEPLKDGTTPSISAEATQAEGARTPSPTTPPNKE